MRGFQRVLGGVPVAATVREQAQRSLLAHAMAGGAAAPHHSASAAQREAGITLANLTGACAASRVPPLQARWIGPASFVQQARFMSIDKYSLFGGDEAGEQRTSVESYNRHGFMVNSVLIQGAVILLPETTLLWNVAKMEDIRAESLVALRLLLTKPELCIIGTGRRMQRTPKELDAVMKAMGIPYDVMDTVNALATFNVLNEEGRNVVGAFLPLDPIEVQQSVSSLSRPDSEGAKKLEGMEGPPQVRGSTAQRTHERE